MDLRSRIHGSLRHYEGEDALVPWNLGILGWPSYSW